MKRILFLVGLLFTSICNIYGDNKEIVIIPKPKEPIIKPRAPQKFPIQVTLNTDLRVVEVVCWSDLEGEVFIYNSAQETVDYSPCINSVLSLSSDEYHTILIQGDGWSASGIIE